MIQNSGLGCADKPDCGCGAKPIRTGLQGLGMTVAEASAMNPAYATCVADLRSANPTVTNCDPYMGMSPAQVQALAVADSIPVIDPYAGQTSFNNVDTNGTPTGVTVCTVANGCLWHGNVALLSEANVRALGYGLTSYAAFKALGWNESMVIDPITSQAVNQWIDGINAKAWLANQHVTPVSQPVVTNVPQTIVSSSPYVPPVVMSSVPVVPVVTNPPNATNGTGVTATVASQIASVLPTGIFNNPLVLGGLGLAVVYLLFGRSE